MPLFIDLRNESPSPSVMYHVSDEYIGRDDPHNGSGKEYLPLLIDLGEVRIAQQYIHGGLVSPEYGALVVSPALFASAWPPPVQLTCWVSYVAPGASPAATYGGDIIVMAIAHLAEWDGSMVRYDLAAPSHPDEVENVTIVGDLDDVCTEYASSLILPETVPMSGGLTYSGRSPAPAVNYRVDGSRSVLGVLGDIAAFFTHRIVVNPLGGATMTDATQSVGTDMAIRPVDAVSITYLGGERYRRFQARYVQPYIKNIELRIKECGACALAVLSEVGIAKTVGGTLSKPTLAAVAVDRRPGLGAPYDPSQASYPASNLLDNTQSTTWATLSGYYPYEDTVEEVRLQIAVASGTIAEYALTSRTNTPYCAPTKWDLYGYDVSRTRYQYITSVESPDWGSAEQRKFQVPADTNWPVQVDGDLGARDTWEAPVVGNQQSYGSILSALGYIKTVTQQDRIRVTLPMGRGKIPRIGQAVNIVDDTTPDSTTGYFVCASLTYNFAEQIVVAEGPGAITSR